MLHLHSEAEQICRPKSDVPSGRNIIENINHYKIQTKYALYMIKIINVNRTSSRAYQCCTFSGCNRLTIPLGRAGLFDKVHTDQLYMSAYHQFS